MINITIATIKKSNEIVITIIRDTFSLTTFSFSFYNKNQKKLFKTIRNYLKKKI